MNSLKKGEGVPLLNFEGGARILLLNFERGPGVLPLNFRGLPRHTFKLRGGSRVTFLSLEGGPGSRVPWSQGPSPTFRHAKNTHGRVLLLVKLQAFCLQLY